MFKNAKYRLPRAIVGFAAFVTMTSSAHAHSDDVCFGPQFVVDESGNFASSVDAADLDGDGDMDVVGTVYDIDEIRWWANEDGAGAAWIENTISDKFQDQALVRVADVDGDGDLDVAIADPWIRIAWCENLTGDGTTWIEHTVNSRASFFEDIRAADIDGDGDIDLVVSERSANEVTWWENDGGDGVQWTEHHVAVGVDEPHDLDAADVDADGNIDIVGSLVGSDDILWWRNVTGQGDVWIEQLIAHGIYSTSVDTADFDGDGDLDVVCTEFFGAGLFWFENIAGDGTLWQEHVVDNDNLSSPYAFQSADFDGDGDPDILGVEFGGDRISWWDNVSGDGATWARRTVDSNIDHPFSVCPADIDGDGDLDVIGGGDPDIGWWENADGCTWDLSDECDNRVDGQDLLNLLGSWGSCKGCEADFDGDGFVGAGDLVELLGHWGVCP